MIFIVHKEHGANNVSESEVETMQKIGWFVSTHAEWMAMNGKGSQVPNDPVEVAPKAKRGRPFKG